MSCICHCKKGFETGLYDLRLQASNMAICMLETKDTSNYSVEDARHLRTRGNNGETSM